MYLMVMLILLIVTVFIFIDVCVNDVFAKDACCPCLNVFILL